MYSRQLLLDGSLHLLSRLFQAAVALRHFCYDRGWLASKKASVRVISVGNIACGGTGKTPFVRFLAEELSKKAKVAILSRGYRSQIEKTGRSLKVEPATSATLCGDEPLLLAQQLPQVDVWVGKRRSRSASLAVQAGAEVLLLDDGMQHRALQRDVEIVLLDAADLFGKGSFLPKGLLRDSPKRLSQADLIVLHHVKDRSHFDSCLSRIAPYSQAPCCGMRFVLSDLSSIQGKKAGVFCGIAKPHHFLNALSQSGVELVEPLILADHQPISPGMLRTYATLAASLGAEVLLCTEKDAVKLHNQPLALPLLPVKGHIEIIYGHEHLQKVLS